MTAIEKLITDIASAIGKIPGTPKDFDQLSQHIQSRTGEPISSSTLKRLWGYLPSESTPSLYTLNLLSRYLGYKSWEDFQQGGFTDEHQSDPVMSRHLNVAEELCKGDRLRLTWHPDRICDVEYEGDLHFKVLRSEKTRILADDTFDCGLIIENEPLYIDNLRQGDLPPVTYVCGKKTGVRFERIISEE